jgi:hypothetical protein
MAATDIGFIDDPWQLIPVDTTSGYQACQRQRRVEYSMSDVILRTPQRSNQAFTGAPSLQFGRPRYIVRVRQRRPGVCQG